MVVVREYGAARAAILEAASQVLTRGGAVDFSTRAVAAEAGVNQSLIHYHFGTKEKLMLAVLADMHARLLERQARMYHEDRPIAEKWARAVEYYRNDLESGYVRLLAELWAIGFSNPVVGAAVRAILARLRLIITEAAADALRELRIDAISPDELSALVENFWYGMEFEHLLGVREDEGFHWRTLDTIGRLLGSLATARAADASVDASRGQTDVSVGRQAIGAAEPVDTERPT